MNTPCDATPTQRCAGCTGECNWEAPTCIERHTQACRGEVEYRPSLSGTGTPIPRCDFHWHRRCDLQDEINQRYPTLQPSDFDPGYAGERWDDEY